MISSTQANYLHHQLLQPSYFPIMDPNLLYAFTPCEPSPQALITEGLPAPTPFSRTETSGNEEPAEVEVKQEQQEGDAEAEEVRPERREKRKYRHHRNNRRINTSYYWSIE